MTTHTRATRPRNTRPPLHQSIRKAFSTLILVLAFAALVFAGYQVKTGQFHATPVLSGSMRPGLQPGDVVVTRRVPISDLHVRDVVVFYPPNETERQTVHRIVKLTVKNGTTAITTWGDANLVRDPAVSSLKGTTAYRMVRIVPLVGYPAIWLQNAGRGMLIIALGALLLIAAAVTLLRPDKPAKPSGRSDPPGKDDPPGGDKPADSSTDPLEAAAR